MAIHINARMPDNTVAINDSFFIIFNVFSVQDKERDMILLK